MNKTVQHVLYFLLGIVALFFIFFPMINSAISKNYHLIISENGNGDVYTIDITESEITVSTNQYNNLATEKKGHAETTQTAPLSEENYQRLAKAFNTFAGPHIFVRWHSGYAFYFEDTEGTSTLYQATEREKFLELARISSNLALGDTKMNVPGEKRTYVEYGSDQLKSFLETNNIESE
ncbi:MAG: hypothetical protein Q4F60_02115 [Candidatus Saccharibacteria bacterium]|nr:hypothetical protein [Candidatus Saccharibacteria bacterium]